MSKTETVTMWLTKPRYIQQFGETEPRYVDASPERPTAITMPAMLTRPKRDAKRRVVLDENGHMSMETVPYPDDPPGMMRKEPAALRSGRGPGPKRAATPLASTRDAAPPSGTPARSNGNE